MHVLNGMYVGTKCVQLATCFLLYVSIMLTCSHNIPCQPHTDMVTLTEPPSTNINGLVVGLPLGVLLAVSLLITTVAVVIAARVQLSRKEEEIPSVEYEVVGPPQQPQGPDSVATDMNVAYASTSFNTT